MLRTVSVPLDELTERIKGANDVPVLSVGNGTASFTEPICAANMDIAPGQKGGQLSVAPLLSKEASDVEYVPPGVVTCNTT